VLIQHSTRPARHPASQCLDDTREVLNPHFSALSRLVRKKLLAELGLTGRVFPLQLRTDAFVCQVAASRRQQQPHTLGDFSLRNELDSPVDRPSLACAADDHLPLDLVHILPPQLNQLLEVTRLEEVQAPQHVPGAPRMPVVTPRLTQQQLRQHQQPLERPIHRCWRLRIRP
jgi:hypothetical protein